jgi:hypothetical protein
MTKKLKKSANAPKLEQEEEERKEEYPLRGRRFM